MQHHSLNSILLLDWFYNILIQETIIFKVLNFQGCILVSLIFKKQ